MSLELLIFIALILVLPLLMTVGWSLVDRRRERRVEVVAAQQVEEGLDIPASLHPVIDPDRCIGSGACVVACPEKNVLGMMRGQAWLIGGANCIGHGRCAAECPVQAIRLVFGTAERGVDLPVVSTHFESNVPGIFIAGELGGMGLIRNAVTQGVQAVTHIASLPDGRGDGADLDLLIVGAGPAGLAAAMACKEQGLRYRVVDREGAGGAILHYPRHKVVMTEPVALPGYGNLPAGSILKEELLEFFDTAVAATGIQVDTGIEVTAIAPEEHGMRVETRGAESMHARRVLLAIGRRGVPRKLEVPGEESPNVVYRLIDPEQYAGRRVLVVGGGDSALEAAVSLSEVPGTRVSLSYRGEHFRRARPANRDAIAAAASGGRVELLMSSQVREIRRDAVQLDTASTPQRITDDAGVHAIVLIGGELPNAFLARCGVEVETHHGA